MNNKKIRHDSLKPKKIKKSDKIARKSYFMHIFIIVLIWVIICSAGFYSYYFKVPESLWEKFIPIPDGQKINVIIEPGMTAKQAARAFEINGALDNSTPSQLVYWLVKFGIDKKLRPGNYKVVPSSAWMLARQLRNLKPALEKAVIIPGLDFYALSENLESQNFDVSNLKNIIRDDKNYPSEMLNILKKLPYDENLRITFLEPETYFLAERNLNELVKNSASNWWHHWKNFISEHNLTAEDIRKKSVIASMVEREVLFNDECARVAGVIYNRINSNMLLQIDATVVYAWRLTGRKLTRVLNKDLEINSPYNTYKNPGLPPGPICIPGFASWAAAFVPEANEYFYYVAGRDGHHYFAKNYNDHLKNIRQVKLDK